MNLANALVNRVLVSESVQAVSLSGLELDFNGLTTDELTFSGTYQGLEYQAYMQGIRVGYDRESLARKDPRYLEVASLDIDLWGRYSPEGETQAERALEVAELILSERFAQHTNSEIIVRRAALSYKLDELSKPLVEISGGFIFNKFVSINAVANLLGAKSKITLESGVEKPLSFKINAKNKKDVSLLGLSMALSEPPYSEWDISGKFDYEAVNGWLQVLPDSHVLDELRPLISQLRLANQSIYDSLPVDAKQLVGNTAFQFNIVHGEKIPFDNLLSSIKVDGALKHHYHLTNHESLPFADLELGHQFSLSEGEIKLTATNASRLKLHKIRDLPMGMTWLGLDFNSLLIQSDGKSWQATGDYALSSETPLCENLGIDGDIDLVLNNELLDVGGSIQFAGLGLESKYKLKMNTSNYKTDIDGKGTISDLASFTQFLKGHQYGPEPLTVLKGGADFNFSVTGNLQQDKNVESSKKQADEAGWLGDFNIVLNDMSLAYEDYGVLGLQLDAQLRYDEAIRSERPVSLNVAAFHLGVPIENTQINFDVLPSKLDEKIKLSVSDWRSEIFGGVVSAAEPFQCELMTSEGANENQGLSALKSTVIELDFSEWDLQQVIDFQKEGIVATGEISGKLPIAFNESDKLVSGGIAMSNSTGSIKYQAAAAEALGKTNDQVGKVINILKGFEYDSLKSSVELSESGHLVLPISFSGRNPEFQNGRQVNFNLNFENKDIFKTLKSLRLMSDFNNRIEDFLKQNNPEVCPF